MLKRSFCHAIAFAGLLYGRFAQYASYVSLFLFALSDQIVTFGKLSCPTFLFNNGRY